MLRKDGVKSLYRGFMVANLGMAPYLATSFAVYDTLAEAYPMNALATSTVDKVMRAVGIGTLSGMSASLLTYPLDTLRF